MTSQISMDALLDHLAQKGLSNEVEAHDVLRATLAVLGERLVEDEAEVLADALPGELAEIVEIGGLCEIAEAGHGASS